ncbi:MAG: HlyD family efflux transporter periplasmic adaptor subunit [Bacteroidetes bacterium]|nr:HlyD family efflux transporter periplasmic adaptor subunit [Bacteroidota bacterium]MBU1115881.1 HlyD family efflux transporter periplasmic adaptor subunit [Bacteroidota bacterium]MBU1797995.1 HlyD family efflux transporter periplasmic adaptor subunit [Bacteroidota bacterium]
MGKLKSNLSGSTFNFINKINQANKKYLNFANKRKFPKIFRSKFSLPIIVLLAIFVVLYLSTSSSIDSNIPTFTVKKNVFLVSITESGEMSAKSSIAISAPRVRGVLKIVQLVPEGEYIKAGEVVAKFDPTEALAIVKNVEAQLEISRSNKDKLLANHQSQIAQMESDLKSAELSFELSKLSMEQMKFEAEAKRREAELQHRKNELNFQKIKQTFESNRIIQKSELENMNVEIRQKNNDLEKAKRDLDDLTLISSSEGLVVYGNNWNNQGQKFQIGDQPWPGQGIVTLPDLSKMESRTFVNEVDISKVKIGQKVLVKLDAFQDSSFIGTISKVAKLGKQKDSQSTIKVFDVFIDIEGASEILKPGMTTSNKIIINEIKNKIFIPHEALFEDGENFIVYKKNGSSFDEVNVTIGEKSDDFVVIESGLEDRDVVALIDINNDTSADDLSKDSSVQMPENGK